MTTGGIAPHNPITGGNMIFWESLGRLLKVNDAKRAHTTVLQREDVKHKAYTAVLKDGHRATDEYRQIVVADLMNFCGHMVVRDAGA